jgi:hypothetical protein
VIVHGDIFFDVFLRGFEQVINDGFVVLGVMLTAALAALPPFPAPPDAPSTGILAFICWIFPLGPMLAIFSGLVTCWITFLVVKIALRWVKAL